MQLNENVVTPVGIIKFPHILEKNDNGKYSVAIVLDPATDKVFLEDLQALYAGSRYPKSKGLFSHDKDKNPETGQWDIDNGKIIVNFKSDYPIPVYDAKKKKLENTDVGYGSKARISFKVVEVDQFKCLTKYVQGIQVIELKEGRSAESCGFSEEEGYVAPEQTNPWDETEVKS